MIERIEKVLSRKELVEYKSKYENRKGFSVFDGWNLLMIEKYRKEKCMFRLVVTF